MVEVPHVAAPAYEDQAGLQVCRPFVPRAGFAQAIEDLVDSDAGAFLGALLLRQRGVLAGGVEFIAHQMADQVGAVVGPVVLAEVESAEVADVLAHGVGQRHGGVQHGKSSLSLVVYGVATGARPF